jgi:hypothetical protein
MKQTGSRIGIEDRIPSGAARSEQAERVALPLAPKEKAREIACAVTSQLEGIVGFVM